MPEAHTQPLPGPGQVSAPLTVVGPSLARPDDSAVRRVSLAFVVAIVCALWLTSLVGAQQPEPTPTVLTIRPLDPIQLGERAIVDAKLTTAAGAPVANAPLILLLDGVRQRQARTDAAGLASFRIQNDLKAGAYRLEVAFDGLPGLLPSRASTGLKVNPATIEVRSVPPLAGVRFSLDGQVFSSDQDGVARVMAQRAGRYRLEVMSYDLAEPAMRAEFSRWADGVFLPYREIVVPLEAPLQVGFNLSYQVQPAFVDPSGAPVDAKRISSLTLKGNDGSIYRFDGSQMDAPWWLPAVTVTSEMLRFAQQGGLETASILYSIESVIVDGANVVNQGEQRFSPKPGAVWQIGLSLYSARFSVRDALFGFPLDSTIYLEYPNGLTLEFPFHSGAEVVAGALARGSYRVSVTGPLGRMPPTQIALYRDQDVQLDVVSYLDLAVLLILLAALVFSVFFAARPRISLRLPVRIPQPAFAAALGNPAGLFRRLRSAGALRKELPTPQARFKNILSHSTDMVYHPGELIAIADTGARPRRRFLAAGLVFAVLLGIAALGLAPWLRRDATALLALPQPGAPPSINSAEPTPARVSLQATAPGENQASGAPGTPLATHITAPTLTPSPSATSLSGFSLTAPAPTATSTQPAAATHSPGEIARRVAQAEAALRTGEIVATIDYGNGALASATLIFDLGSVGRAPGLHITTTYQSGATIQTTEFITVGDRSWRRQPDGRWAVITGQEGVWGQVRGFLPNIEASAAAPDVESEEEENIVVLFWYDAGRNADMTLTIDRATGLPRELRQVSRATRSVLTVTYRGWNTPVVIRPPG